MFPLIKLWLSTFFFLSLSFFFSLTFIKKKVTSPWASVARVGWGPAFPPHVLATPRHRRRVFRSSPLLWATHMAAGLLQGRSGRVKSGFSRYLQPVLFKQRIYKTPSLSLQEGKWKASSSQGATCPDSPTQATGVLCPRGPHQSLQHLILAGFTIDYSWGPSKILHEFYLFF